MLQVTFTGNAATAPLGVAATLGNGVGGALYVEGATDAFNVTGCRFQRNSAQVRLRPLGLEAGLGLGLGSELAVYVKGATDAFNVTGCRFQRNSAQVRVQLLG